MKYLLKRLIDITGALLVLIITSPLWIGIIAWILFVAGPPIFYTGERSGRGNSYFNQIKFRTMFKGKHETEDHRQDFRVIPWLRFLRITGLDSLPELINVIKGDMSLVGPRPFPRNLMDLLASKKDFIEMRARVRPGITGMAQICLSKYDHAYDKLFMDAVYANSVDLLIDARIMVKTVFKSISFKWE